MNFFVYVIQSQKTNKIYIGQTANLDRRLKQHNDPENRITLHTKRNPGPWKLVYREEYNTRSKAMRREKQLKSGQGREWLYTHILSKI